MSISVSNLHWEVKNRLAFVLTCVLYCKTAVTGEVWCWNPKYECVGDCGMVGKAMGSNGKGKYGGE